MKKIIKLLMTTGFTSIMFFASSAQTSNANKNHKEYDTLKIESRIPGLRIAMLHEAPTVDTSDYPVLFLHGSIIPVEVSFGFRMGNYSWMDNLAANGYDVYALDFLGYGNSDRYPEMKAVAHTMKSSGDALEVYQDVDKAIDFIRRKTGKPKVYLIGHSWGGAVAALYAGLFKDKVQKLILYAPYTIKENEIPPATVQKSYAVMTPGQRIETFRKLTPPDKECRMENEMFTVFADDWMRSDPLHTFFHDDSVRFPAGPAQDLENLQHHKTFYTVEKIQVPVLLIRGEWDDYPNDKDAGNLFAHLANTPYKKYVVIEKATHILHLEKSRFELYDEVLFFLRSNPSQSH